MLGANLLTLGFLMFQAAAEEAPAISFNPLAMWGLMGWPARCVVILLFIMSAWSIGVMIDRYIAFAAARKQSRVFAPSVAGALKDGGAGVASPIFRHPHFERLEAAGEARTAPLLEQLRKAIGKPVASPKARL